MISVPAKMICSKMTFCALALIMAVFGDQAHAESDLDASYTISFARIRVGEINASVVFGPTEYAMSASGNVQTASRLARARDAFRHHEGRSRSARRPTASKVADDIDHRDRAGHGPGLSYSYPVHRRGA
jgi:hypothetical protein